MKRYSLVMLGMALILGGLLVGCDIPTDVSAALTTGASTVVGALLTWAFQSASGNSTTTTTKMVFDMVAMML